MAQKFKGGIDQLLPALRPANIEGDAPPAAELRIG
jgi:hypothetical protein